MQARYTQSHDKGCPSCNDRIETCGHLFGCDEEGRVDSLHKSQVPRFIRAKTTNSICSWEELCGEINGLYCVLVGGG